PQQTILTDFDLHLLAEGTDLRAYEKLGTHPRVLDGVRGMSFAVWAPNAREVSVIGDFNRWDSRADPLCLRPEAGIWEGFVPGLASGARYRCSILQADGVTPAAKADPYACYLEQRPRSDAIAWDLDGYRCSDEGSVRGSA